MIDFINEFLPYDREGIYLVGGSVRDTIIGIIPRDFDIISKRNIDKLALEIAKKSNSKIIPIGKKPFKIFRVLAPKIIIDISPLKEFKLKSNLLQRDFTVNAIAYNISKDELIDPTNGLEDIRKNRIRMINTSIFCKDPIRLIRAYRIALELNFKITQKTKNQIFKNKDFIHKVAVERVWAELTKIFNHPKSHIAISGMIESGLLFSIFHEFNLISYRNKKFNSNRYIISAYTQIESILESSKNNKKSLLFKACINIITPKKYPILKYSLLLNCMGQNFSGKGLGNLFEFYYNSNKIEIIIRVNNRLKLSKKQHTFVKMIANNEKILFSLFSLYEKNMLLKKNMFKTFEICGQATVGILLHALSIGMTQKLYINKSNLKFIKFLYSLLEQYMGPYLCVFRESPLISGKDLIKHLKIKPSPQFKKILLAVHKAKIYGEISSRNNALKLAKKYLNYNDIP